MKKSPVNSYREKVNLKSPYSPKKQISSPPSHSAAPIKPPTISVRRKSADAPPKSSRLTKLSSESSVQHSPTANAKNLNTGSKPSPESRASRASPISQSLSQASQTPAFSPSTNTRHSRSVSPMPALPNPVVPSLPGTARSLTNPAVSLLNSAVPLKSDTAAQLLTNTKKSHLDDKNSIKPIPATTAAVLNRTNETNYRAGTIKNASDVPNESYMVDVQTTLSLLSLNNAALNESNAAKPIQGSPNLVVPKTETSPAARPVLDASTSTGSPRKATLGTNTSPRIAALIFSNPPPSPLLIPPPLSTGMSTTSPDLNFKEKFENERIEILPKINGELIMRLNGGKMTISCPIRQGTKLKVIGGDLYLEGNIGNKVSIEVPDGSLFGAEIGQHCKVIAKEVVCDDVGEHSELVSTDGSIHTSNIAAYVTVKAIKGDVLAENVSPDATIMLEHHHTIHAKSINPNSIKGGRQYTFEELDRTLDYIANETGERDRMENGSNKQNKNFK